VATVKNAIVINFIPTSLRPLCLRCSETGVKDQAFHPPKGGTFLQGAG
jgi:hypothetical protein